MLKLRRSKHEKWKDRLRFIIKTKLTSLEHRFIKRITTLILASDHVISKVNWSDQFWKWIVQLKWQVICKKNWQFSIFTYFKYPAQSHYHTYETYRIFKFTDRLLMGFFFYRVGPVLPDVIHHWNTVFLSSMPERTIREFTHASPHFKRNMLSTLLLKK